MITIKLLDETDTAEYRRARLECLRLYPENFGSAYEDEVLKQELFFEKQLKSKAKDSFMFGAFNLDRCIGLCGFLRESRSRTAHRGEVIQMFVHPDHHGSGIGKKLLVSAIDKGWQIEGIEQIALSVVSSNVRAIEFYRNFGFAVYGELKNCFKLNGKYLNQTFMILYKK